MKHITINGQKMKNWLDRDLSLHNGDLVLSKRGGVEKAYMVISFRDHKNCYKGDKTNTYCTLLDLDTGYFAFEERCSRTTTVRRVLSHLLRLRDKFSYGDAIPDDAYGNWDVDIVSPGEYSIDITI
jgi:hypothetical protein